MAETLEKLRPDRDLQCYFERPSAAAALSGASATGCTISGVWRQQFDWVVLEWNRDNTFEHPALRNLPDGDLSRLHLSYDETRQNAILADSTWFPTVDWPNLRIWAASAGVETLYKVPLKNYATPLLGSFVSASASFDLLGTPTAGDYVELTWLDEHHTHQLSATDGLAEAILALTNSVNTFSTVMRATAVGTRITLSYSSAAGANGNRIGVYGNVTGAGTESWSPGWQLLSGGASPSTWHFDLDFSNLHDSAGVLVPTTAVRKVRWTWAADIQPAAFVRSEFAVTIANWTVLGLNRGYQVAGPGSRRIEDDSSEVTYAGAWTESRGNFSGGTLRYATTPGARVSLSYTAQQSHQLYLGTRKAPSCTQISIQVDSDPVQTVDLSLAGEDVLVRILLKNPSGQGTHTVSVTHAGAAGTYFYFDFFELAVPTPNLPVFAAAPRLTLATDWDTDHSIALAPERTAWLINTLGFIGRANHYAGALWFYELVRPGHHYASATVTFSGTPEFGKTTAVWLGPTAITHLTLIGDTPASIARAFELLINAGSTGVWAQATGAVLTIQARAMGAEGNAITLATNTNSLTFSAVVSSSALAGGVDGDWRTDLAALPRINRAARDWTRSFSKALKAYGIDMAVAFSMELQHGDPAPAAGIAQRYPDGSPVQLNTPALQTNFAPSSQTFWRQVYLDMAGILTDAGQQPYLQFGEVQWWYFPAPGSGMPFYDDYTTATFQTTYGRAMHVFTDNTVSPASFPQESAFLPQLIGSFTSAVIAFVRQTYPTARFEVLYPPDVNAPALNQVINLPLGDWTPAKLDCFKTENFTHTGDRDLDKARSSIQLAMQLGFARAKSSHLVGIGAYATPWAKEVRLSQAEGLESVVLFALDQLCLIGYALPLARGMRRSVFLGS